MTQNGWPSVAGHYMLPKMANVNQKFKQKDRHIEGVETEIERESERKTNARRINRPVCRLRKAAGKTEKGNQPNNKIQRKSTDTRAHI